MLEKYYRINQAAGVSINIHQGGTVTISVCGVIANSNQLDIDKKITDVNTIEELKKHLPNNTPVALNLVGKGILHKQIEKTEEISQGSFSKVLPNANVDNFYIQNFVSGDFSFVSVVRKIEADKWIGQIKDQGFIPLMLSLGPFPVYHIIPQLNVYGTEVTFNGNMIKRNEQSQWTGYRYDESALTPFALKIESEGINEKLIMPYAAAFQLVLASKLDAIRANVPSLEKALEQRLGDNKTKVQGVLILACLFTLLFLNFVLFSWLNSSNAKLTEQVGRFTQNTNNRQDINDQVKKKEGLLQNLGWDGGINKSALVDQLASLMPDEITLKEAAINPIDLNSSRAQRSLVFFDRRIRINGISEKIVPVNEWMARIKTKKWVKNTQLESYSYNNELNTGQFIITIDY